MKRGRQKHGSSRKAVQITSVLHSTPDVTTGSTQPSSSSKPARFKTTILRASDIAASDAESKLARAKMLGSLPSDTRKILLEDFHGTEGEFMYEETPIAPTQLDPDENDWEDEVDDTPDTVFHHILETVAGPTRIRTRRSDPSKTKDRRSRIVEAENNWNLQYNLLLESFEQWEASDRHGRSSPIFSGISSPDQPSPQRFECDVLSLESYKQLHTFKCAPDQFACVVLLQHGLVGSSPLKPSTAFDLSLLRFYRVITSHHRRLGIEPFIKSIARYTGYPWRQSLRQEFSDAYDIYLRLCRGLTHRTNVALGRQAPDWRIKHSCPACHYKLHGEEQLTYETLLAIDGGMSLKRFISAGRADPRRFQSDYLVSRQDVDKFKDVVPPKKAKPKKKGKGNESDDDNGDGDQNDIDLEVTPEGPDAIDAEGGGVQLPPRGGEGFEKLLEGIISSCVDKWKANADESKKVMWECFEEAGIFIAVCRHGILLYFCDIVQSGELFKYPLALLNAIQKAFPGLKLIGYDIGCTFSSTAARGIPGLAAQFVIPAMHGYAHNRSCQLGHHPKYKPGAGKEDWETCERFFSSSNDCARTTRYSTPFHRLQTLDLHFQDSDINKVTSLGKFVYDNYVQSLTIIRECEGMFAQLNMLEMIREKTFERWLKEERDHLDQLAARRGKESETSILQMNYLDALKKADSQKRKYEQQLSEYNKLQVTATKDQTHSQKMAAPLWAAYKDLEWSLTTVQGFEDLLNIKIRWTPSSPSYQEAERHATERRYRMALDRIELLVVQRLFELHKSNLASTGYKLRVQIAKHLKTRSKTIKSAVTTFNKAAAEIGKRPIKYKSLIDLAYIGEFDLLKDTTDDIREKEWSQPAMRLLMDNYFNLLRAKEELRRLNIEHRRLLTWIEDDAAAYQAAISDCRHHGDDITAALLKRQAKTREDDNLDNIYYLAKTSALAGFSGSYIKGKALHPLLPQPTQQTESPDTVSDPASQLKTTTEGQRARRLKRRLEKVNEPFADDVGADDDEEEEEEEEEEDEFEAAGGEAMRAVTLYVDALDRML